MDEENNIQIHLLAGRILEQFVHWKEIENINLRKKIPLMSFFTFSYVLTFVLDSFGCMR